MRIYKNWQPLKCCPACGEKAVDFKTVLEADGDQPAVCPNCQSRVVVSRWVEFIVDGFTEIAASAWVLLIGILWWFGLPLWMSVAGSFIVLAILSVVLFWLLAYIWPLKRVKTSKS